MTGMALMLMLMTSILFFSLDDGDDGHKSVEDCSNHGGEWRSYSLF